VPASPPAQRVGAENRDIELPPERRTPPVWGQ
jgi:hypothetical protein